MHRIVNIYCAIRLDVAQYSRASGAPTSGGTATGFVMFNESLERNYLVTNRHVVDPSFRGDVRTAISDIRIRGHYQASDPHREPEAFDGRISEPTLAFHDDPTVDLAVISGSVAWVEGDRVTAGLGQMSRFDMSMLATAQELRSYVAPGDAMLMAGYPSVAGAVGARPVLTQGVVSSDPRFPATIGPEVLAHSVLSHSFSWGGMSGAPVISVSATLGETRIIGVNAGHVDLHGVGGGVLSHFVRAERLLEMLASLGDTDAERRLQH